MDKCSPEPWLQWEALFGWSPILELWLVGQRRKSKEKILVSCLNISSELLKSVWLHLIHGEEGIKTGQGLESRAGSLSFQVRKITFTAQPDFRRRAARARLPAPVAKDVHCLKMPAREPESGRHMGPPV